MFDEGVDSSMDAWTEIPLTDYTQSKFVAIGGGTVAGDEDGIMYMWLECNDSGSGCEPFFDGDVEYSYLWVDAEADGSTAPRIPMSWLGPITLVEEDDGAVELVFAAAAAMAAFLAF